VNYWKRHIGDYLKDAGHLSLLEHGVYTRLLDTYYTHETGLTEAEFARLIQARTREERETVGRLLGEFFSPCPDGGDRWYQPRCEREIAAYNAKAQKNREVGLLGGRPKVPKGTSGNHDGSDDETLTVPEKNPSHKPIAITKKNPPSPRKRGAGLRFEDFWLSWPKNERKQDKAKCLDHWKRHELDEQADAVLSDVRTKRGTEKWREGFIEAPLVYLRGQRWMDGVTPNDGGVADQVMPWHETPAGVDRKAVELGLVKWDRDAFEHAEPGSESFMAFRARIIRAARDAGDTDLPVRAVA
jgi:uncharacterized protein YdaU (DUF1376 family)